METNGAKDANTPEGRAEGERETPRQTIEEYANETSAHGVKKVVTSSHLAARLVWTVLFLAAITMIIFQLFRLVQIYRQWPVNVKTKRVSKSMNFPAVTICNLNTIYFSKVQDDAELIGNLKSIAERYSLPLEYFPLKDGSTGNYSHIPATEFGSDHPLWEARQNLKIWLASKAESSLREVSQPREEFIISCQLGKEPCDEDFDRYKDDDFGLCYQWTPKKGKHTEVNLQGPTSGMSLTLNVEEKDYLPFFASSTGVRLHVHEPGDAVVMHKEGTSLPTGFEASIGIRPVQTIRLSHPYGDCDGSEYSKNRPVCERECLERTIEGNCSCTRQFIIGYPDCLTEDFPCLRRIEEEFSIGLRSCQCKLPCKMRVFEREIAMTVWPSYGTLPLVTRRVNEQGLFSGKSFTPDDIQSNLLQVTIYFSSLIEEIIEEEPAYQWENLLSDIGGQLGLWLGISVMSLAELLEFLGSLIAAALGKLRPKKTSPSLRPQAF